MIYKIHRKTKRKKKFNITKKQKQLLIAFQVYKLIQ